MDPITLLTFLTGSFIVSSTGYATVILINTYYENEFIPLRILNGCAVLSP